MLEKTAMIGELAFDGMVRPARGVLPIVVMLKNAGFERILLPAANASEAAVIEGIDILPVHTLSDCIEHLNGAQPLLPHRIDVQAVFEQGHLHPSVDLADVKGQAGVKRALEIAAAGGHNMIMVGPPGSGKTMLAKRLPTILPPLSIDEALETTTIHSVAGILPTGASLVTERPFRAPHHTISDAALVGGGVGTVRAGEITLAHHGVLFLDELPEFQRNVLEVLRQPLEDRCVRISRTKMSVEYPANVMLVCSMNPCPCGHFGSTIRECTCKPEHVAKYMARISGPLLDRIDLHVDVPAVAVHDISHAPAGESSVNIRKRVVAARKQQQVRFAGRKDVYKNADMTAQDVENLVQAEPLAMEILKRSMQKLSLSARAYGRILKVSRTIADLNGSEAVLAAHMAEAVNYRTLDRPYWNG
jgi:magnesium chelatase family protein